MLVRFYPPPRIVTRIDTLMRFGLSHHAQYEGNIHLINACALEIAQILEHEGYEVRYSYPDFPEEATNEDL